MLQRGYIILIIGAALLISGIIISALWAGSFAGQVHARKYYSKWCPN